MDQNRPMKPVRCLLFPVTSGLSVHEKVVHISHFLTDLLLIIKNTSDIQMLKEMLLLVD